MKNILPFSAFKFLNKSLGNGIFGDIILVQNTEDKQYYACKQWNIKQINEQESFQISDLKKMISQHKNNSNFVVSLEWVYEGENKFYFIQ